MPNRPIEYYNRYTRLVEREQVYGDELLKWAYGTKLGRLLVRLLLKRPWFSRMYGKWMDKESSRERIKPFVEKYGLDASEFLEDVESYRTFNEFFYRKLRPESRPVNKEEGVVVFPADGRHMGFGDVNRIGGVYVKGQCFDVGGLLGDMEEGKRYEGGTLVLSRLCPVDYHRFHFPVDGVVGKAELVNGPLYSVNPLALRRNLGILWENRRMKTVIESETWGRVVMLEIGASCVGSIVQTYEVGTRVKRGDEKGYFRFGGSSTVLLFEKGRVTLDMDLVEASNAGRELYARIGDRMGQVG